MTSKFIHLPTGDAVQAILVGSCVHYPDHGVMLQSLKNERLVWITEPDNDKAKAIRDEIVAKLVA